jgi:hypothetical protein
MVGGTGMLFLGGLNLYLAARKDHYALHRWVGRAYLGSAHSARSSRW